MSDSDSSPVISKMKTTYSEAVRTAKRLGIPVRVDPMVYLTCNGTRIDIAFLQGRIDSIYEKIGRKIIEISEGEERSEQDQPELEDQDVPVILAALKSMNQ